MSRKKLVINGQGARIEQSGGAGRYAQQLYKKIIVSSQKLNIDCGVFPINFHDVEQQKGTSVSTPRDVVSLFKHAVFRSCPPILFDRLQQVYSAMKGGQEDFASLGCVNVGRGGDEWWNPQCTNILHELTNYGTCPEMGRVSLSPKLILAVTFLDIQDCFYPEYFKDDTLRKRRMSYAFYKDRADCCFAISEFTKQTMVERLGIDPEKIKVTHLAADDLLILEPSNEINQWAESFGRFLIYPAKLWKHKNHEFLLNALAKRKNELKNAGLKLLLTGGFGKDDLKYLYALRTDCHLEDIVEILGFVSDEQLQALLKRAEFLVFPSIFEGFGMPILEAMTLGCPVLSSNAGSLPEVGGDAAVYFDPMIEDDFISLIDSVCTGNGIDRITMIRKGFENCKRFSWEKTITETVQVYKKML